MYIIYTTWIMFFFQPNKPKVQPPSPPTPCAISTKTFPILEVSIVYILYAILATVTHYILYIIKFEEGNLGAPRALALVLSAFCAALVVPIYTAAECGVTH